MSHKSWWMGLVGTALVLIGVWGAWIPHRAAALVLSSWDLAEFIKFVPGAVAVRELFYFPVWCNGLVLGVLAGQGNQASGVRWQVRLVLVIVALALMVAIWPPYPHLLNGYQSSEFRWQFFLGISGVVAVLMGLSSGRWPTRVVGGLLLVLALVGAIPALWQFLKVRGAIAAVYDASLGWGWGLGIFLAGWGLVGAIGGRLLVRKGEE
jgi:hypothetical protein